MRELARISKEPEKLFPFLEMNAAKLHMKEIELSKIIHLRKYRKLAKKMQLQTVEEYFYGLKTLFDFETELSNFLVHISQLNNILYAYCTKRDSKTTTQHELSAYKKQNGAEDCPLQNYIIMRMRNALMHGRVELSLYDNEKIELVFRDKFNHRNETISVALEDMEVFLNQKNLYAGIPKETMVLSAQHR